MWNFQVGAADYISVAKNYHTVFISEVPVMSMKIRDKVCLPTVLDKRTLFAQVLVFFNFALPFFLLLVLSCDSGSKIYNIN